MPQSRCTSSRRGTKDFVPKCVDGEEEGDEFMVSGQYGEWEGRLVAKKLWPARANQVAVLTMKQWV